MEPRSVYEEVPNLQLIDVREPDEWEAGRIEAARHIRLDDLADRLGEIDPHRPVVTVCRSGGRSGRGAELLRSRGFDARSMDGGMKAWAQEGLPFTTPDGRPGTLAEEPAEEPASESGVGIDVGALQARLVQISGALEERFGDREPTDEEARQVFEEMLASEGKTPEEIKQILD